MQQTKTPLAAIICPQCGVSFVPGHHLTAFCTPEHKQAYHDTNAKRGKVLLPFAQVARMGKRGFTAERRYALAQYSALLDRFNAEDKAAGRSAEIIVREKMAKGWAAADL